MVADTRIRNFSLRESIKQKPGD